MGYFFLVTYQFEHNLPFCHENTRLNGSKIKNANIMMHSPTRVRSNIATFSARDSSDLHGEDGGVLEDEPELE